MKRRTFILLTVIFIAAIGGFFVALQVFKEPVPVGQPTPKPEGEGWIDLLDANHAEGWENVTNDKDIFEIKEGVLHIFGRMVPPLRYAGYTTEKFSDFQLHIEFKIERHANSGVFLRSQSHDPVHRGFEVQVLEDFGNAPNKNSCGALYDVTTPMYNMSRPAGEWNSFDITVKGKEVIVIMNGWMIVHTDLAKMTSPLGKFKTPFDELPAEGLLMLQDHGGEVWYRNIVIKKL
ncbi:MAG TPA: DUF1080 domain-containing protein [Candidatus Hydrogenedentes bacterium]|nr:DUF1080 domain-containing protein [Candidatus Hydrogenedentota bacterium]